MGTKLEGQKLGEYEKCKTTVKDHWVLKQKLSNFKILNPWR